MDTKYSCPICNDTGWVFMKNDKVERLESVDRWSWQKIRELEGEVADLKNRTVWEVLRKRVRTKRYKPYYSSRKYEEALGNVLYYGPVFVISSSIAIWAFYSVVKHIHFGF